jgi:hypothetical protein
MKSKVEKAKTIIMPITGGIGRNIFATAMIRNFKKAYPDKNLFVVAGFPDVFFNNPNLKRVYGFNSCHHLYEDYIERNEDTVILEVEPYRHPEYMVGNRHVVDCWCEMMGVPCEDVNPELFFTRNEKDMALAFLDTVEKKHKKPLILFQHVGGKSTDGGAQGKIADRATMYRRPLTEKVVQELVDKLDADGYKVGCVQSQQQFNPDKAELISYPLRSVMALVPHVKGIIAIDSFLQHTAAAVKNKALVLWAGTSPDRLGYAIHKNMRRNVCPTPECHRPNSYAFDINPNGSIWDCPYSDACTEYTSQEIYESYKEMKGDEYNKTLKQFKKDMKDKKYEEIPSLEQKKHTCPAHGGT